MRVAPTPKTAASALCACAALCLTPSAAAQAQPQRQREPIDAERFKPAVTHDGFVNAEGSGIRPTQDPFEFALFMNYARNPLVITGSDGSDIRAAYVDGHLGVDVMASLTLAKPFSIGLGMPLYILQTGDDNVDGDDDPSFAGLGDLRIVPKLRLVDDRDAIGLALAVEVRAPTHTGDFNGGARMIQGIPKVILDHRWINGLRFGLNVGVAFREDTSFFNIHAGDEFQYALALGYRFGGIEGKVELGAELNGGVGLDQQDSEEIPMELFPYLRIDPNQEWEVIFGPGIGLMPGYGVPQFRVFAGFRFKPTAHDQDHDGIQDEDDFCPKDKEDRDRIEDSDGCPEEDPDTDKDGVPNQDDDCPEAKETINGIDDDDGCPDTGDKRVIYEEGKFKILDTVKFKTGSAEIDEESHSLLDQVALTMKANPEVKKIRIEGHTDDTGPNDKNQKLSEARANAVREYLIKKGVDSRRLKAKGYGEDRPLEDDDTPEARAKNRRVEFVVE
jgi:outer membrane protein OmpA-like peptidoglycan-associated protein